jgi:hypothetical protein
MMNHTTNTEEMDLDVPVQGDSHSRAPKNTYQSLSCGYLITKNVLTLLPYMAHLLQIQTANPN